MTLKEKIELRLQTLEWLIECCEKEMDEAKARMSDTLDRNDLDIASFMESYASSFKAAYEKRRVLIEEQRNLQFMLKGEDK